MNVDAASPERLHLPEFLRNYREEILDRWERRVRGSGAARSLDRGTLRDHLPQVLERIAVMAENLHAGRAAPSSPEDEARLHAAERLSEGFGLEEVVHEYEGLRDAVLELLEGDAGPRLPMAELRVFNRAIADAVELTVRRFSRTRNRTLSAIDALTSKALTSRSLTGLLDETLQALFDSVPAVDTAAVLLHEGDHLVVRAAAGMPDEYLGAILQLGEGIAGRVAQSRTELSTPAAHSDPRVANDNVRNRGLHAFCAVPLLHGEDLVGVAQIGSTTAREFSQADRVLFRAMAARLTSFIVQAQALEREQLARTEAERTVAQLESMLKASPVGIALLDRDLRYLRVNPVLAELNHLPVETHLGKAIREVVPPAAADSLEALLSGVVRSGEPRLNLETVNQRRNGQTVHLLGSYFPVKDASGWVFGVGGIVQDITERKRADEERARLHRALEIEHARFDSLVRQMPAGVVVAEAPSGRVVLANAQADLLLGAPLPHLADLSEYHGFRGRHPDGSPYAPEDYPLARAVRGERVEGEVLRFDPPQGSPRWLNVQSAPVIAPDGARVGAVATFVDVTELMRVERELRGSLDFQERVMGILGHDLRAPLTVISTSAALLLRSGELIPRDAKLTGRIAHNADRMGRMISDLLDYARARGPGIPLHRQRISLRQLARHVIDELDVTFPFRIIRLTAASEAQGEWDPDRLAQVVHNLLGNALRYSPEDTPVDVEVQERGASVELTVHNAGPPIPPEHLATLFEPFRRGPSAQRTPEGLGLGLFIVRELVRAHGGTVEVASTAETGTTFRLQLPRQP